MIERPAQTMPSPSYSLYNVIAKLTASAYHYSGFTARNERFKNSAISYNQNNFQHISYNFLLKSSPYRGYFSNCLFIVQL